MINWAVASDLDRVDHHRRKTDWVAQMWRQPEAKLLKLDEDCKFTTAHEGTKLRMTKPFVEFDSQRHRLLGLVDGAPVFSVQALIEGERHDLREVGNVLSDTERDIAAAAMAVTQWHKMEPHCPQCGVVTEVINGGFARYCNPCNREHFPRTDPAVIVAIIDNDDRILLGSQASWGNRVSVLAGFVETGESLEQTIHREMAEEVDVTLSDLRYFGSQPWPFPRSLMVGYFARAASTRICVDVEEIASADWYTRERVQSEVAAGTLGLPGSSSIASRMVGAWLDGTAPL